MKDVWHFKKISLAILLATTLTYAQAQAPIGAKSVVSNTSSIQTMTPNAWGVFNTKGFEHNIDTLQKLLSNKSQICLVMKADAYGHGIDNVLPSVIKANIPCVGVTSNEEIQKVRQGGYTGEIMRLRSASAKEMRQAMAFDVQEMLGNANTAAIANQIAKEQGKTMRFHLMLNSGGMDRNGLEMATEQGQQDALAILGLSNLKLTGIMTHFAVEDIPEIKERSEVFKTQSDWLIKTAGLKRDEIILHAANSYTTLNVPEAWFDMVRPGALVYNYFDDPRYQPVFTLKTEVASVNSYPKGSSVGYDKTYTLKRDSLLANLPIGYSDGYLRSFTNTDASKKNYVLIHGQKAMIVGKISMNTTMVDVTDIKGVIAGDEVVLFGQQGKQKIDYNAMGAMNPVFVENTLWGKLLPVIKQ